MAQQSSPDADAGIVTVAIDDNIKSEEKISTVNNDDENAMTEPTNDLKVEQAATNGNSETKLDPAYRSDAISDETQQIDKSEEYQSDAISYETEKIEKPEEYRSDTIAYETEQMEKSEDTTAGATYEDVDVDLTKKTVDAHRYIRLRGLPFSATESDVREFLADIAVVQLHFTQGFGGRPSGECYCELNSSDDVQLAFELDKKEMKKRYIEVFPVDSGELNELLNREARREASDGCVVRLRGLPFSATRETIAEFFEDLQLLDVVIEKENGGSGRPSGEAYVRLNDRHDADRALQRNRQHMGHRYIEVFRSTAEEMERCNNPNPVVTSLAPRSDGRPHSLLEMPPIAPPIGMEEGFVNGRFQRRRPLFSRYDSGDGYHDYGRGGGRGAPRGSYRGSRSSRPTPYDRTDNRGGQSYAQADRPITRVQMRGLPYRATAQDIEEFFTPLPIVDILIGYGDDGRPSGEGAADFATPADAHNAMSRNQKLMGKRYIELFLGYDGVPGTRSRLRSIGTSNRGNYNNNASSYDYNNGGARRSATSYDYYGYDGYSSGGGGYVDTTGNRAYMAQQQAQPQQPQTSTDMYGQQQQGQQSYHQQYEQQQQQYWQQQQQVANAQAMAAATNSWSTSAYQTPSSAASNPVYPPPAAKPPVANAPSSTSWLNY